MSMELQPKKNLDPSCCKWGHDHHPDPHPSACTAASWRKARNPRLFFRQKQLNRPAPRARCGLNFSFLLTVEMRKMSNHTWELSGHQNHENTSTSPIPLGRNPPQWQGHLDGTYPGPFTMSRRQLNGSGHILRSDFVFALCPTLGVRHRKPALQTWSNEGSLPGTEEANICEGRCRGTNSHPKCRSM